MNTASETVSEIAMAEIEQTSAETPTKVDTPNNTNTYNDNDLYIELTREFASYQKDGPSVLTVKDKLMCFVVMDRNTNDVTYHRATPQNIMQIRKVFQNYHHVVYVYLQHKYGDIALAAVLPSVSAFDVFLFETLPTL